MFYSKERRVEVKCTNPDCELYTKGTVFGVNRADSEELKEILRCPGCGKKVQIIGVKNFKNKLK